MEELLAPERTFGHSVRRWLPALLTALLGALIWAFVPPTASPPAEDLSRELDDTIRRMLLAGRQGDVQTYLSSFADPLRSVLATRLNAADAETARRRLRAQYAALKSFVASEWRRTGENEATVLVEHIYADSSERVLFTLRRSGGRWYIVQAETLQRFAPQIPYGTPVFDPPPDAASDATSSASPSSAPPQPRRVPTQ